MSIHKLTAGTGYDYLTRQVAALDATDKGHVALATYYTERGETPGAWTGSGLAGIDGLDAGDVVTAEQMQSLFGLGHHPLAAQRTRELEAHALDLVGSGRDEAKDARAPTQAAYRAATGLGVPFKVYANDFSDFRVEVARRLENANAAAGLPRDWPVPADQRARIRTDVAVELFRVDHGRDPADPDSPDRARELAATIARHSRPKTTAVAGFDLTFSPVKSMSTLWAFADPATAATIERAHQQSVADALRFIERHALYTRLGANGVRQVDVTGLLATAFTHRDSRAGDPDLHTHVAVANKVQVRNPDGTPGRWLAIDGRILFKANVAASETYNTALEKHLGAALGVEFVVRETDATRTIASAADAKRPVREIRGVDPALNARWSARRAVIEVRRGRLAAEFQATHGRPPTPVETLQLAQRATLETRPDKHEPRTLAEQRATWRAQAEAVLGGSAGVDRMLAGVLHPANRTPNKDRPPRVSSPKTPNRAEVDAWVAETSRSVVATLQRRRSTWQTWHVRAEAQRRVRACAVPAGDVDRLVDRLIQAALGSHSVALTGRPATDTLDDAGATPATTSDPSGEPVEPAEPGCLRRSDGSSMYTVAGADLYTSPAILAAEQRILTTAERDGGFAATDAEVDLALLAATANGTRLNPGQADLVRAMATSGRRLQLAIAPAGSGKTTAMRALAAAWAEAGGTVLGLAPSAAAAAALGDQIDRHTDTLAKLTWSIDPLGGSRSSTGDQPAPEHSSSPDDPPESMTLAPSGDVPTWVADIGPRTLVVIDEAGMADTLSLDAAVAFVTSRGGSVRLIGDDQQLAAIGAGGVLRDIQTTHGAQRLTELLRFTDPAEANASLALRDGQPEALGYYLDHHRVHVGDLATMTDDVFTAWQTDRDAGLDALMLAPTRDLVAQLNHRARSHRLAQDGALDRSPSTSDARASHPDGVILEDASGKSEHRPHCSKQPVAVRVSDGNDVSAGDVVITRRNNRLLRLGAGDWVKNGDRWTVLSVSPVAPTAAGEGADTASVEPSAAAEAASATLTVRHRVTGRVVRLPADYVSDWVELGYATTAHGAQGVTADTCHALLGGTTGAAPTAGGVTRQALYTMLTRGRQANHVYLEVVGDGDPHSVVRPDIVHPSTPTDLLETILARDEAPTSATTTHGLEADPGTRLGHAAQRYQDAIHVAAEHIADPALLTALDQHTDTLVAGLPDLADRPAWPALRAHLLLLAASDTTPMADTLAQLRAAAQAGDLATVDDPAAVLDWRLHDLSLSDRPTDSRIAQLGPPNPDSTGLAPDERRDPVTTSGPLPWLPAIPTALAEHPTWGPYLRARHHLVTHLAEAVRTQETATAPRAVPVWVRHGVTVDPRTRSDVEVWRAAMQVDTDDRRPTGPRQLQRDAALHQHRLDRRLRGDRAPALLEWGHLLHAIDPAIERDPFTAVLAQRLASISRAGLDARNLVLRAHLDGPLPDDHAAAALWWRVSQRISPGLAAGAAHHPGFREGRGADSTPHHEWIPRLRDLLGDRPTDHLVASTSWPALASVIDNALARGWRLDDLLVPCTPPPGTSEGHRAPRANRHDGAPRSADGLQGGPFTPDLDPAEALVWRISVLLDPVPPADDASDPAMALGGSGWSQSGQAATDLGEWEDPPPRDMWDGVPRPADEFFCVEADASPDLSTPQLTDCATDVASHPTVSEDDLDAALLREAILRDSRPDQVELTDADVNRALIRAREWDFSPVTRERLVEVNQLAQDFFSQRFPDSWAQGYLRDRLGMDLTGDNLAYPGHAPAGWNQLTRRLRRGGVTDEEMLTAGLVTTSRNGHLIDRFRDRLTFPIVHRGAILGFVGRRHPDLTDKDHAGPKYLNTPDTPLFHKGAQLYGLTPAAQLLLDEGATPVLVEGPIDALAVTKGCASLYVGLSPLGTALTEDQAFQFGTITPATDRAGEQPSEGQRQPIVATDADPAGRQSATRAYWMLTNRGLDPRLAHLPGGLDPADVLQQCGPPSLTAALYGASLLGDHVLTELLAGPDSPATRHDVLMCAATRPGHTWEATLVGIAHEWHMTPRAVVRQLLGVLRTQAASDVDSFPAAGVRLGHMRDDRHTVPASPTCQSRGHPVPARTSVRCADRPPR